MLRTVLWCFVTMLVVGLAATVTARPFIFPSLGPTAIMLFANPLDRYSSPRHVLLGHFIGAASGFAGLAAVGLIGVSLTANVGIHRVLAAAIALALTAGIAMLLKAEHPPAGATTLIVALGILPQLLDIAFLMAAVFLLTVLALVINRASGIHYPLWRAATSAPAAEPRGRAD
jgi:CBS-domain-containing membrane protein